MLEKTSKPFAYVWELSSCGLLKKSYSVLQKIQTQTEDTFPIYMKLEKLYPFCKHYKFDGDAIFCEYGITQEGLKAPKGIKQLLKLQRKCKFFKKTGLSFNNALEIYKKESLRENLFSLRKKTDVNTAYDDRVLRDQ